MGSAKPTPKWVENLAYLTPTFEEHEINGTPARFYPVSVGLAFKLRRTAEPIAKALTVLFQDKNQDFGTKTTTDKETQQIVIEPLSPTMAEFRAKQSQQAWSDLLGAFTDEENMSVISEIIQDSLREDFPDPIPAKEFFARVPMTVMPEMLMGILKANKGVFGPLGKTLENTLSRAKESVAAKIDEAAGKAQSASTPG